MFVLKKMIHKHCLIESAADNYFNYQSQYFRDNIIILSPIFAPDKNLLYIILKININHCKIYIHFASVYKKSIVSRTEDLLSRPHLYWILRLGVSRGEIDNEKKKRQHDSVFENRLNVLNIGGARPSTEFHRKPVSCIRDCVWKARCPISGHVRHTRTCVA